MRRVAQLVACAFFLLPGAAYAATVDLADVATPRIDGAANGDQTGAATASAGDVNGDGRDDMLVGSPDAGPSGRAGSGSAHVIFGGSGLTTLDLGAFPAGRGFRIQGAEGGDSAGFGVAGAGDVNGDGVDDVIVGAPYAYGNDAGGAYVIYGSSSPTDVDLASWDRARGFRIRGAADNDHAGWAVGPAGDLNGDGTDDVIVGAQRASNNGRGQSGSSYVVYGSSGATDVNLGSLGGRGVRFDGATAGSFEGSTSVGAAGDVNADGRDDVFVNDPQAGSGGRTDNGSVYVIYGSSSPVSIDLAALTSGQGFRIDGAATYDYASREVAGAGDVNGDGIDDLALTAPGSPSNSPLTAAYVVYGSSNPTNLDLASPAGRAFRMTDGSPAQISAIDGAGDVNSDGYDDVVIGISNLSFYGRSQSGAALVVYGSADPANRPLSTMPTPQAFRIAGAAANDAAGTSVAGDVDEDGDGRPDVLVGGPDNGDSMGPLGRGSAYLVRSDFLPRLQYASSIAGQVGQPLVAGPSFYSRTGTPDFLLSGLPAGLSLDPGTGQIRGTPTVAGSSTERITLTDANGRTATTVQFQIAEAAAQAPPSAAGPPTPAPTTPTPVTRPPVRKLATKPSGRCAIRLRQGKVKLTCDITYVRGRKGSTSVTITRGGRTYATAKGRSALKLKVRRRMRAGRYRLTVRVRSGSTVVTRRQTVRLR